MPQQRAGLAAAWAFIGIGVAAGAHGACHDAISQVKGGVMGRVMG